jgi:hypothetical protein
LKNLNDHNQNPQMFADELWLCFEKLKRVQTIQVSSILRFHLLDLVLGVAVVPLLFVRPLVGVLLPIVPGGAVRVLTARLALKLICQRIGVAMHHVIAAVNSSSWDLIEELLLKSLL